MVHSHMEYYIYCWPLCLRKDIAEIEGFQKYVMKMIICTERLSQVERLKRMGLISLERQ